ncbi:MAG: glycosyltransferase family 1 protein [Blastocatellia bacterium]|nr:glycosyltransferase family 1 protein [Blastocatellia bacterium]
MQKTNRVCPKTRLPFLCVYADDKTRQTIDESLTNLALKRSPVAIPIDGGLKYDPFYNRHIKRVEKALNEFKPDVIHLTGVNDVSIIAAILAYKRGLPLIGSWHTNIHEFAARRLDKLFSFLPDNFRNSMTGLAERKIFEWAVLYYKMPQVVLSPNQELVESLVRDEKRASLLMARGVDTEMFNPSKRTVKDGVFRFGYIGRLRAEKNVRLLEKLEKRLLELGKTNFKFLIVGEGTERDWLEKNMQTAEFTGYLEGEPLAEAYANLDVFIFPSETDTFGNVSQEAMASGVPAIVTDQGGPKFVIKDGETGFVAKNFDDFVKFAVELMDNPAKLSKMKQASIDFMQKKSWDAVFEGVYEAYDKAIEIHKRKNSLESLVLSL